MTKRPHDTTPPLPGFDSHLPARSTAAFDDFWRSYPHKQGKAEARKRWARMTPAERVEATDVLPLWCQFWQLAGTDQRFIPHGSTWLNQSRWEDDIPALPQPELTRTRGMAGLAALRAIANAQAQPDMRALGQ
jgi:hypothetical protein